MTAQEQADKEWISIEDSFPPEDENVLLANVDDQWVVCGQMNRNGNFYNQFKNGERGEKIRPTHWMPLPQPPQSVLAILENKK